MSPASHRKTGDGQCLRHRDDLGYFAVPRLYQHRVLWGILGVITLRAVMIGLGAALVEQFSWVLYVFAAFLIVTGIKMWMMADKSYDVGASPCLFGCSGVSG